MGFSWLAAWWVVEKETFSVGRLERVLVCDSAGMMDVLSAVEMGVILVEMKVDLMAVLMVS
jgi:hypothetical protein